MKHLRYSITTIAAICLHTSAFASEYKFSGIEWLSTKDTVKEVLTKKGYAFSEIDKDGDLVYSGEFMGQKSQILCIINPQDQIVKIVVRWQTPDSKCLDFYEKIKDILTSKYGQPCSNFETYKTPYYKGDGFEEQAIRRRK